jgi:uncharacterized hydrophobic protein (TIGR00271 family)
MARIKKPKKRALLRGLLKNDLEYVDSATLREKIHDQSRFSILYFSLLLTSVLVCTLGLLINSTAVVIGGMLIAPLMWPLARVGFGIAHRSPHHLYRGFLLVLASIIIGTVAAYLITSISPIKVINDEILARTAPTLMDLFVALAAGLVAAIAITQKKIADSLAGVAIAVSLMPPLCTVGIAFSLREYSYGFGALLLFAVNAASITLVTTVVLSLTQYARKERVHIAARAMAVNLVFVLLLSIPLVQFLSSYSFELRSYSVATAEMNSYIKQKDSAAAFENVRVVQTDRGTVTVSADLLLPSDSSFTYEDNEALVSALEGQIGKKVLLNLRIQSIIEPISKNQQDNELKINRLRTLFAEALQAVESSYRISSISVTQDASVWTITSDVLINPESAPTSSALDEIRESVEESIGEQVELNVTFVPRITLRSNEQTLSEEARKNVESITASRDANAVVGAFAVSTSEQGRVSYTVTTSVPQAYDEAYLVQIRDSLAQLFGGRAVQVQVRLLQAVDIGI